MGAFDHFPYTNFHELNLMWILEALKEIQTTTEQFVAINSLKYADPIQWSIVQQYEKNTIVIDPLTGTAYISVQAVPSGVALTNTDYWTVVFDLGSFVTRAAKNFTDRWESQWTVTATFPSNVGDWIVWNDTLYMVISNIVAGDQYVIDSNIKHFTMEELYGEISDTIGDLDNLTTSDKNSIVDAINSIVTRIRDGYDNYAGRYIPADETTNIFNVAINPDEWFIWGDYLYEATTTINPGDTLGIGVNIQRIYLQGIKDGIEGRIVRGYDNYAGRYIPADETTNIFNVAINPNEWFIWGDYLYEATTTINIGDTLGIGVNIQQVYLQGVRDTIESEIGDRDNLITTDDSNLVAAINENRGLINTLNSTVGDLYSISPFAEYSDYLIVAKHNGQYDSIVDAYNDAVQYASATNRVAILVLPGVYREQLTALATHYIDIIGVGDATMEYNGEYPDSPLYIGGDMEVRNMKFVSLNPDSGTPVYAIHVEGGEPGNIKFSGCTFTAINSQAFGAGFTTDRRLTLEHCTFISWYNVPLYVHNRGDADATNQELVMQDCIFRSLDPTKKAFIAEDARYRLGTEGVVTSLMTINAQGCSSELDGVQYQEVQGGVVTYSLPFIPKAGAPYYKQVYMVTGSGNTLKGLTDGEYQFELSTSAYSDPSGYVFIPCKDSDKYTVQATVQHGGYGGGDVSSDFTVTVGNGYVELNTSNSTLFAQQLWIKLVFTLA